VPVQLDLSCFFGVALAAWSVSDVLAVVLQGRPRPVYWVAGAAVALLMLASIGLHEAAHCLAAARAGIRVRQVELSLFGGLTRLGAEPDVPGVAFRIALAGPLASLALAAAAAGAHVALVELGADDVTAAVVAMVAVGNLAVAVLNLIPALPLDGGHAARAALERRGWRQADALRLVSGAGRVLGGGLLVLAVLASAAGDAATALWCALLGLVLVQHAERARDEHAAFRRRAGSG
jgi:Zn-dependent protease